MTTTLLDREVTASGDVKFGTIIDPTPREQEAGFTAVPAGSTITVSATISCGQFQRNGCFDVDTCLRFVIRPGTRRQREGCAITIEDCREDQLRFVPSTENEFREKIIWTVKSTTETPCSVHISLTYVSPGGLPVTVVNEVFGVTSSGSREVSVIVKPTPKEDVFPLKPGTVITVSASILCPDGCADSHVCTALVTAPSKK